MADGKVIPISWTNADNRNFYNHLTVTDFKKFAESSQLNFLKDICVIQVYIQCAKSILEVNAGYGRAIEGILSLNYKNKISAIERNMEFCAHLSSTYGPRVNLINDDILTYQFNENYDLITLLWTSIAEFNPSEQISLLKILASILQPKGYIIIDVVDTDSKLTHAKSLQSRQVQVSHGEYKENCFVPNNEKLELLSKQAKLKIVELIKYSISSEIKRKSYVLAKY